MTTDDTLTALPVSAADFVGADLRRLYRNARRAENARDFERYFLEDLRAQLDAEGVAVWFDPGGDSLFLRNRYRYPADEWQQDVEGWQQHGRLLRSVADSGEPRAVEPGWFDDSQSNPTGRQLLIAMARVAGRQRLLLEAIRRPGCGVGTGDAHAELDLIQLAAEFAADHVRTAQLLEERHSQGRRKMQSSFALQVHATLEPPRVAYVAANEGARLIGCDRVTVALSRRRRGIVTAVTGQTEPNRRANDVKLMEAFATTVLKAREAVVCAAGQTQCPEAAAGALQALMAASGSGMLVAVPIMAENATEFPLGVVIAEQFDGTARAETLIEGVNLLAQHTTISLRNATAHDRIALKDLRGRIGRRLRDSLRLRRMVLVAVMALLASALYFVPWQLKLKGEGVLRAQQRRGVFAAESGTVRELPVSHGMRVAAGQTIAVLENNDLSVQHQQTVAELVSVQEQLKLKNAKRGERGLSPLHLTQIDGELAELAERKGALERQAQLLGTRIEQLTLRSPIEGTVATWNPEQQLLNRPVDVGQLLVQVIVDDGAWQIELAVPDVEAGHVRRAWEARHPDEAGLPVEYVLATQPERKYRGRLVDVAARTENTIEGPVLFVTVTPDADDLPPLHDGAEVRGKIHCGERRAGFVLFREVIEFVQAHVLF